MIPPNKLWLTVTLNISMIQKEKYIEANIGEVLKLIGVCVLTTQF